MNDRYASLRQGLEEAIAWKKGRKTGARVRAYSAIDVAKIRRKTKLSQREFSASFLIPLSTLRQWEQGQRVPRGPAQALLKIIDRNAPAALKALH